MRFYFEEAELWEQRKQDVLNRINNSNLPLLLFGQAPAVDPKFFDLVKVPLNFMCDNDPAKWGSELWGLKVICPSQIQGLYPGGYNVLILVPFVHEITSQLQTLPVPPSQIFHLDLYFEKGESAAYFQSRKAEMERIYDCLADQLSKDTYEAVIRYRINRNAEFLAPIALPRATQYFPAQLGATPLPGNEEIFVDAGAFTGDTVQSFYSAVQGSYRRIYALEPEESNYGRLRENTKYFPNVICRQVAVGSEVGQLHFSADTSSSKADLSGSQIVPVDSLDHIMQGVPVTYLKMDVEGMECPALHGTKELIQSYHPKLAICAYHSDADMIDVPKLILELDPTYRLYFRHYTTALVETVCYAI